MAVELKSWPDATKNTCCALKQAPILTQQRQHYMQVLNYHNIKQASSTHPHSSSKWNRTTIKHADTRVKGIQAEEVW